jgi:hypothetical protein
MQVDMQPLSNDAKLHLQNSENLKLGTTSDATPALGHLKKPRGALATHFKHTIKSL